MQPVKFEDTFAGMLSAIVALTLFMASFATIVAVLTGVLR